MHLGTAMVATGRPINAVEDERAEVGRALGHPDAQIAAGPTGVALSLASGAPPTYAGVTGALRLDQPAQVRGPRERPRRRARLVGGPRRPRPHLPGHRAARVAAAAPAALDPAGPRARLRRSGAGPALLGPGPRQLPRGGGRQHRLVPGRGLRARPPPARGVPAVVLAARARQPRRARSHRARARPRRGHRDGRRRPDRRQRPRPRAARRHRRRPVRPRRSPPGPASARPAVPAPARPPRARRHTRSASTSSAWPPRGTRRARMPFAASSRQTSSRSS